MRIYKNNLRVALIEAVRFYYILISFVPKSQNYFELAWKMDVIGEDKNSKRFQNLYQQNLAYLLPVGCKISSTE